MASDLEQDTHAFLVQLDTLTERLRPRRRAQDAHEPACSPRELRVLGALGRDGRMTMTAVAAMLAALSARERQELLRQLGRMIDSNRQIEAAP